jgi:hypothetical protein
MEKAGLEGPIRRQITGFPPCGPDILYKGGRIRSKRRPSGRIPSKARDTGLFRFGKDRMDKRKAWRAQEQALIERWNATATRQRDLQAEIARQSDAGAAPSPQLLLDAERSRSEMETVRREVARMKVQFSTGKRY